MTKKEYEKGEPSSGRMTPGELFEGMWVAISSWRQDTTSINPYGQETTRKKNDWIGEPMEVAAINLPFVALRHLADTKLMIFDVREFHLIELNEKFIDILRKNIEAQRGEHDKTANPRIIKIPHNKQELSGYDTFCKALTDMLTDGSGEYTSGDIFQTMKYPIIPKHINEPPKLTDGKESSNESDKKGNAEKKEGKKKGGKKGKKGGKGDNKKRDNTKGKKDKGKENGDKK